MVEEQKVKVEADIWIWEEIRKDQKGKERIKQLMIKEKKEGTVNRQGTVNTKKKRSRGGKKTTTDRGEPAEREHSESEHSEREHSNMELSESEAAQHFGTMSTWNWSPETADDRDRSRKSDLHNEDGMKTISEREGEPETAYDRQTESEQGGSDKLKKHHEDANMSSKRMNKRVTNDRRPSEDDSQAQQEAGKGEGAAHEKEPPDYYSTGQYEGGFQEASQEEAVSERRGGDPETADDRRPSEDDSQAQQEAGKGEGAAHEKEPPDYYSTGQYEGGFQEASQEETVSERRGGTNRRPSKDDSQAQQEWYNIHGSRMFADSTEAGKGQPPHEKERLYSTGHFEGGFQEAAEGDGTRVTSPRKEQAPTEAMESVAVITDDDHRRKRPRKVRKVPATKETQSQNEASTGGTVKKEYILKSGLQAQQPILLIPEMPNWPRWTGGSKQQFNKRIPIREKKWIDSTIFRLHYVTTNDTLTEEQKTADRKTMEKINRLNHRKLNIFILASLKPGIYLTDDIINYYCEFLTKTELSIGIRKSRFFIFTTFFYQQGQKAFKVANLQEDWPKFYVTSSQVERSSGHLANRSYLIFPACNGNHYILLVFNVRKWQLLIFDPLNFTDFQEEAAYFVITAVKQILYVRAPKLLKRKEVLCYAPKSIPRQPAGTGDCGIFVAMYLDAFVKGLDLTNMEWEPADILNFRYRLARDLVMKRLPEDSEQAVQVD